MLVTVFVHQRDKKAVDIIVLRLSSFVVSARLVINQFPNSQLGSTYFVSR